jgi:hypothetical protein
MVDVDVAILVEDEVGAARLNLPSELQELGRAIGGIACERS